MIERFNFYDVYGYLLPGAIVVGLFWLPFGIIHNHWPADQLGAAVFILGFSYVVGQVLQTIAQGVVPSTVADKNGNLRAPSDIVLDPDDAGLSTAVKKTLSSQVQKDFEIDLQITTSATGSDEISRRRRDAFFLCRALLVRKKVGNYAEQFEGLYALHRGLTIALLLGSAYLAGWGCSQVAGVHPTIFGVVLMLLAGVCLFVQLGIDVKHRTVINYTPPFRRLFYWIVTFVFGLGLFLGGRRAEAHPWVYAFGLSACVSIFCSVRCFFAYRAFADHFAKTVWRDYSSHRSLPEVAKPAEP